MLWKEQGHPQLVLLVMELQGCQVICLYMTLCGGG
jgi:hypothetical protein